MKAQFRNLVLAAAAAAFALSAMPQQANATHQFGHAVAGGIIGGIIGGAIVNSTQPRYVAPAPVYVAPAPVYVQPRCHWERQKYYDPYSGWLWRRVQVCY